MSPILHYFVIYNSVDGGESGKRLLRPHGYARQCHCRSLRCKWINLKQKFVRMLIMIIHLELTVTYLQISIDNLLFQRHTALKCLNQLRYLLQRNAELTNVVVNGIYTKYDMKSFDLCFFIEKKYS